MFTQAGLKWYLTSFQQFVYFYLNNLNNTNAEQDSQGLCLKEREGESLASLALVGRTLHICIIIVDNLCVHYFNYCNLPSLHIIINGAAFSELNWHQFMRPLAWEGHTVRSLLCPLATSFTQSLLIWITALAILCRPPGAPLDCGIPLAQFGNYVQSPSDATRPATWRRLHNVLNCATFAKLRLLRRRRRRWQWQWRRRWRLGLGVESSEKLLQRLCALCLNIHARLCHFCPA